MPSEMSPQASLPSSPIDDRGVTVFRMNLWERHLKPELHRFGERRELPNSEVRTPTFDGDDVRRGNVHTPGYVGLGELAWLPVVRESSPRLASRRRTSDCSAAFMRGERQRPQPPELPPHRRLRRSPPSDTPGEDCVTTLLAAPRSAAEDQSPN